MWFCVWLIIRYILVGRATRHCMNDGWDGRIPVCEGEVSFRAHQVLVYYLLLEAILELLHFLQLLSVRSQKRRMLRGKILKNRHTHTGMWFVISAKSGTLWARGKYGALTMGRGAPLPHTAKVFHLYTTCPIVSCIFLHFFGPFLMAKIINATLFSVITCPSPNISNAYWINYHKKTYNPMETIDSFRCRHAYVLFGPSHITCGREGQWLQGLPQCRPSK